MSFNKIEKSNLPSPSDKKIFAGSNLFNNLKKGLKNFDIDKLMNFVQYYASGELYADKALEFVQKLKPIKQNNNAFFSTKDMGR